MWVLFDVNGTVLTLEPAREALRAAGHPDDVLEQWFSRALQGSDAYTMAQRYRPFADFAEPALRHVLATRNLPETGVDAAVTALSSQLAARPDALPCLSALLTAGHRVAALTRSSERSTREQLAAGGIADCFSEVISCDDVNATKPSPEPYCYALMRLNADIDSVVFVAAHGWDVVGADAVGLRTIWISETEKVWPLPGEPPGETAGSLSEVPSVVARMAVRRGD